MPREIVHWAVVEKVQEKLPAGSLRDAVHRFPAAARLGAILHDAPYYYHGGGHAWEGIAESIHGKGGRDTYEPFRIMARNLAANENISSPLLWSLFVGLVTHAAADIIFHPLVFYFTGDYYDNDPRQRERARANHRLFEVWLDSWAANNFYGGKREKIWNDLHLLGVEDRQSVTHFLSTTWNGPELHCPAVGSSEPSHCWKSSIYSIAMAQYLFTTAGGGHLLSVSTTLSGGKLRGIEALSSKGRTATLDFFKDSIAFRNPVTGLEITTTCTHLLDEAVTLSLSLLAPIVTSDPKPLDKSPLGHEHGPSLSSGVVEKGPLRYFADKTLPWLFTS